MISVMTLSIGPLTIRSQDGLTHRGRPWAESAVWGALWILSTGETPDWLADHQPSRIRRRLRSMRPSELLWALRQRADTRRFRASDNVLDALEPYLRTSGTAAIRPKGESTRLEGYVTPGRFEWIRDNFPIVASDGGHLTIRVSEFTAFVEDRAMPPAFIAVDMASFDIESEAEHGLVLLDDLLRDFNGDQRYWLTVGEMARAISVELERSDEIFALRILAKGLSEARSLTEAADIVRYLQEPASTGDLRWDVLLASAIARECRMRRIDAPKWTDVDGLEPWWFPALVDETLIPMIVQRTPPELSSKGIWLDERALVGV